MASSTSDDSQPPPKSRNGSPELLLNIESGALRLTDDGLLVPPAAGSTTEREAGCSDFCARSKTSSAKTIALYDIINASIEKTTLTIHHVSPKNKSAVLVSSTYTLTSSDTAASSYFVDQLLARAYADSQRNKRIKVIINPHGGTGKAQKIYTRHIQPIFAAAGCTLEEQRSTHLRHAEEIAQQLDTDAYDVVACCSGDGVPHEVFNGLARQARPRAALRKVAVVQLPCGSGNGMSWNLNGTDDPVLAALAVVKGVRMPLDLVSITQGSQPRRLSFLSQAVGIIAESDLATENLRWMGDARFSVGYTLRLVKQTLWPMDVSLKLELVKKEDIKHAYQSQYSAAAAASANSTTTTFPDTLSGRLPLTPDEINATALPPLAHGTVTDPIPPDWHTQPHPNMGNFYAGNMAWMAAGMRVFATALPADGTLDLLRVDGDVSRRRALALADVAGRGGLIDEADVAYVKVSAYRLVPRQKEGYLSIDGERFPFEGFQAEVHRGLGTVLGRRAGLYMANEPAG